MCMCLISSSLDYSEWIVRFTLHHCVTIVCAQHRDRDRITDLKKGKYSGVFPIVLFPVLSVFIVLWMILLSSSSCWSRGTALSRTTPRTSCSCRITCTTRTAASARFIKLDWAPPHERSCPGMVLERASPHSSSGCWWPANRNSPWTSRMMTPAPLWTQSPVNLHPTARSCQSPPQTESQSLPRSLSHCHQSDRADDRPRAWAPSVWPGARADSTSDGGYSCGDRGGYGKPRPRRHRWGWAHTGLWTVNRLGFRNTLHSTFIRTVGLAKYPTQPPSPTASQRPVPFLNAIFAGFCQSLCSPSAHHLWRGLAAGLPISSSIGVESGGSLDFSLRGPDSATVLRPSGSTMASSSLVSTGARQSTNSTGLPHPSGSTLVSRPPTSTSGLHSSSFAPSFRPSGSVGLLLPSSSTSVLCRSASGLPDLRLHLSRQSLRLHLGPPDPLLHPGSSALCRHLGLHLHLLRRHWSAPWSRRPFLLHGSSLRRLHRGPPSWLWPGSRLAPPAPSPSCLRPGSSLHRIRPGSSCFLPGSFHLHPGLC